MRIVFVGLQGVPYYGRACDPRLANTANLLSNEADVFVLNRYSSLQSHTLTGITLNASVKSQEIIKRRVSGALVSKLLFVLSILKEPFSILSIHKRKHIDILHVYSGHYLDFLFYYIISRLIGARVVYQYVEYRTAKPHNPSLYHRVNNYLCDKHGARLWDGCIAISNYLEQRAKEVNPRLQVIKITPLCDFSLFDVEDNHIDISDEYVMFCGHAGYFEVLKLVIDAYRTSSIKNTKKLLLVLGGNENQINNVHIYAPGAIIRSKIPYNELVSYYKHAHALLIPLRDTLEDIARFPNKICEYTAAHGLIVTTNYGEIPYYFMDGENAIVAKECTSEAIAEKLDSLENGDYNTDLIKKNSYKTGLSYFSIDAYSKTLPAFLNNLKNQ